MMAQWNVIILVLFMVTGNSYNHRAQCHIHECLGS